MRWPGVCCTRVVAVAASLAAILMTALSFSWSLIFEKILASKIVLDPDSRAYSSWVEPTVPIYFDVYLFNWTNADQFAFNVTPHVQQVGPYRFREQRRHVNITWHPLNSSVAYRTFRSWTFEPEMSSGSLNDSITMINVVAASATYRARTQNVFMQMAYDHALTYYYKEVFVTKLARELLFEGYPDEMMETSAPMPKSLRGGAPPFTRFGWFYERNNSINTEGYMEVTTGQDGRLPGQILQWNHLDHLPYYQGQCAKLEGSAGEFMPRNLSADTPLTVFVADLCRPLHLEYEDHGEMGGLPYNKYGVNERTLDSSPGYHENECFCNGACSWSGIMNVSACRFETPSFISLPHFLHADPKLRQQVTGLQPDPEKHSFYFAVEPKLGVPLDVSARFQLNIFLKPHPLISLFKDMPETMFPVMWVEQRVMVSQDILDELRMVRYIMDWGGLVCTVTSFLLILLVVTISCFRILQKSPAKYTMAQDLTIKDIVKDEAEIKLNPM